MGYDQKQTNKQTKHLKAVDNTNNANITETQTMGIFLLLVEPLLEYMVKKNEAIIYSSKLANLQLKLSTRFFKNVNVYPLLLMIILS